MSKCVAIALASGLAFVSASVLAADGDLRNLAEKQTREKWLWSTGDFYPKRGWAERKADQQREGRAAKRAPAMPPGNDAGQNAASLEE